MQQRVLKENRTRALVLIELLKCSWFKVRTTYICILKGCGNVCYYYVGGDVVSDDGTGSISIYGEVFNDENLDTQHTNAGFLSMANKGKNPPPLQIYFDNIPYKF